MDGTDIFLFPAMECDPPHMSFLKILTNIREVSQENPPSRGTDSWCYSGMVPTGLDYHAPTLTKLPHCLPGQQRTLAIVRSACLVATFIALYTKSSLCWLYSKHFKLSSFWRKQSPRHNSNTVGFSLISLHPYSALSQILSSVPFQCVHTVFLIP